MPPTRISPSDGAFLYRLALGEGGTSRGIGGVHEMSALTPAAGGGATLTLKRGAFSQADLYAWVGRDRASSQARTIRIEMMGEDGRSVLKAWQVVNARPVKYTGPVLNAKGGDVAIEELVLSAEGLETV